MSSQECETEAQTAVVRVGNPIGPGRDSSAAACFLVAPRPLARELGMSSAFDEIIDLAKRIGITVRHARLGGGGGGLAVVKGGRQLFVDLDADPADQLEQTAKALAGLAELDTVFVRPDVRQLLDRYSADQR